MHRWCSFWPLPWHWSSTLLTNWPWTNSSWGMFELPSSDLPCRWSSDVSTSLSPVSTLFTQCTPPLSSEALQGFLRETVKLNLTLVLLDFLFCKIWYFCKPKKIFHRISPRFLRKLTGKFTAFLVKIHRKFHRISYKTSPHWRLWQINVRNEVNAMNAVKINISPRFTSFTAKRFKKYALKFFSPRFTAFLTKNHHKTSTRALEKKHCLIRLTLHKSADILGMRNAHIVIFCV